MTRRPSLIGLTEILVGLLPLPGIHLLEVQIHGRGVIGIHRHQWVIQEIERRESELNVVFLGNLEALLYGQVAAEERRPADIVAGHGTHHSGYVCPAECGIVSHRCAEIAFADRVREHIRRQLRADATITIHSQSWRLHYRRLLAFGALSP